jgi:hypothetical protein
MWRRRIVITAMLLILLSGCAGMRRGCSSFWATQAGADWIVVQYDFNMDPKCCWKLQDVSISNEPQSDGIYWKDSTTGHLVHVSGWYNRVQVEGGRYDEAAKLLGVDVSKITNGRYKI